ncbi:hypothetical protein, partial [Rhizobium oryzicola]
WVMTRSSFAVLQRPCALRHRPLRVHRLHHVVAPAMPLSHHSGSLSEAISFSAISIARPAIQAPAFVFSRAYKSINLFFAV